MVLKYSKISLLNLTWCTVPRMTETRDTWCLPFSIQTKPTPKIQMYKSRVNVDASTYLLKLFCSNPTQVKIILSVQYLIGSQVNCCIIYYTTKYRRCMLFKRVNAPLACPAKQGTQEDQEINHGLHTYAWLCTNIRRVE